jgi:hypothetical protein
MYPKCFGFGDRQMGEEQRSTILWKACARRVTKRNTNFRFVQNYKQSMYGGSLKHISIFSRLKAEYNMSLTLHSTMVPDIDLHRVNVWKQP